MYIHIHTENYESVQQMWFVDSVFKIIQKLFIQLWLESQYRMQLCELVFDVNTRYLLKIFRINDFYEILNVKFGQGLLYLALYVAGAFSLLTGLRRRLSLDRLWLFFWLRLTFLSCLARFLVYRLESFEPRVYAAELLL